MFCYNVISLVDSLCFSLSLKVVTAKAFERPLTLNLGIMGFTSVFRILTSNLSSYIICIMVKTISTLPGAQNCRYSVDSITMGIHDSSEAQLQLSVSGDLTGFFGAVCFLLIVMVMLTYAGSYKNSALYFTKAYTPWPKIMWRNLTIRSSVYTCLVP